MPAPLFAEDPRRRNRLWHGIQFVMQNIFTFWFRYRARGIEKLPEGGALLLINHQSFLDPLFVGVGLRRPVSYLARDSLFRIPLLGWLLRNTYVIPISRESAGTESLRLSIERCKQGYLVGIFPEGTRTLDGSVGSFKPGFVAIARRCGVPVVPVGVAGAFEAYPRTAKFPSPGRIRVVFGDPVQPEEVLQLSLRGQEASFVELMRGRVAACYQEAEAWRNQSDSIVRPAANEH